MSEEKTIAKGSFWILSTSMVSKLISFLYTIIIARMLATEEIGTFYLVLSVLGILYIFTDLGIIFSLNRYVPYLYGRREFGKLRNLVKLSYLGGGALTFLFSILVFIFSGSIACLVSQPTIAPILQIMSVWLFLREIDNVSRGTLTGRKKMKEAQVVTLVQNFIKLVLTIIAFYIIGFNAEALSIGFLLSFLLVLPLGGYYLFRDMKSWEKTEEKQSVREQIALGKEVISFGLVVTFISAMWTIIQYTDRLMLGYLTEDALDKIAIYSIALGLASIIMLFPNAITGIFFPVVSELYGKGDHRTMNRTLNVSTKWLIMLTVPMTLIIGVFSEDLLRLFYGSIYEAGAVVLTLFVIGLFIRSIFFPAQLILSAMRRLDVELKAVAIATVANIIFNLLFIPWWGVDGAALASLFCFLILSVMIAYYSKKIYGFTFPRESYKPLIAGLAVLLVVFLMKGQIVHLIDNYAFDVGISQEEISGEIVHKMAKFVIFGLLFIFAVLLYFIALLLLKSFGEEEISLLEAGLRRAKIPSRYIEFSRNLLEAKWFRA
jgi:O-antigen/teichoic acid export membrane protein